jgi:pyrrolidone-carboxylate peptidase
MTNNSIILTGFQKYGKFSLNLSGEIVRSLDDKFQEYNLKKIILPALYFLLPRILLMQFYILLGVRYLKK